ncbi:MAG TPA: DUF835 domain-containing protein [Thermoplasmata archaeon]|nr:DUF835 domain-containing protein [Thermoplasmata archaeon]
MDSSVPALTYLSAAGALFLSALVVGAIARQRTRKVFQKKVLLTATLLLTCAVVSNVLISIYITDNASSSLQAVRDGIVLSKRVQATFDYAFSIVIGAFVVVATTPSITKGKDFARWMSTEFPNSYVFYCFIMLLALATIYVSSPTVVQIYPTVIQFEPYFLVFNGVAVATLNVYAPYRFIGHLRRTKSDVHVRRETYLIIVGISGFSVGELLFEIVLPNYGIDLRAPGFLVEMALLALIAYAAREKSFLQGLIVPVAERPASSLPTYHLERAQTYAVLDPDGTRAFEIFQDLVTHGAQGLCITRRTPKVIMTKYGLERTPILWLSRVATEKNSVPPSPPEKVGRAVEQFVSFGSNPVVLLDGVEYLIAHNDFTSVLALLHDLNELVGLHEAILLLPMDPAAFQEREFALIRRETNLVGSANPSAEEIERVAP